MNTMNTIIRSSVRTDIRSLPRSYRCVQLSPLHHFRTLLSYSMSTTTVTEGTSPSSSSSSSSSSTASSSVPKPNLNQQEIRQILNERYLLIRHMEQSGFRRILFACGLLVGPLNTTDLNISSSLDSSMLSLGGGENGSRDASNRKSLSTSGIGKMLNATTKQAPGTGKKASGNHRQSMAPTTTSTTNDRRTSLFVGTRPTLGNANSRKDTDPRPISHASFRATAIKEIELFMIENEYSHPISSAKLTAPTARDFQTMITFLLRRLDTSFTVAGKVEDEVTLAAKALHYPFMPSKTAITAVGAPTTWPALLAMLLWLVELLRYDQAIKTRDADGSAGLSGEDSAAGTADYFWWYLRQAYTLFLGGEDDRIERLDQDIISAFDGQMASIAGEVAAEEATLAALEAELSELQNTQSVLPKLRAEVNDYERDIETTVRSGLQLQEYLTNLATKKAEATSERDTVVTAIERARVELDRISKIVHNQELSVEDVRRMAGTKSVLRDTKERLSNTRTAATAENDKLRMDLRNKLDILNARIKDYHETARALQVVPSNAKWSGNRDWSIHINERALERANHPDYGKPDDTKQAAYALLSCENFKLGQKDYFRKLRSGLISKAEMGRAAIRKEADGVAELAEKRAELTRALAEAEADTVNFESKAKREVETGESRLKEGAAEMTKAETVRNEKRIQLSNAQTSARELSPAVLAELAAAIRNSIAAQEREREYIKDMASRMALRVTEHTQRIKSTLEHASAAMITSKNRQISIETERATRINHVMVGVSASTVSSGLSSSFVGTNSSTTTTSIPFFPPSTPSSLATVPLSASALNLPAIPVPQLELPSLTSNNHPLSFASTPLTSRTSTTTPFGNSSSSSGLSIPSLPLPSLPLPMMTTTTSFKTSTVTTPSLPFTSPTAGNGRTMGTRATSITKKTPNK